MDLWDRKLDSAKTTPLYGFIANEVKVIGIIDMPVLFWTSPYQTWQVVKFHIINVTSSYNAILGCTKIASLKAITSITHLKMKFPTDFGVGEVCGYQRTSRQCYMGNVVPKRHSAKGLEVNQVIQIDPRKIIEVPTSICCERNEAIEKILLFDDNTEKKVKIGDNLSSELRSLLIQTLRSFADIFS